MSAKHIAIGLALGLAAIFLVNNVPQLASLVGKKA